MVGTGPAIGRSCAIRLALSGASVVCLDLDESAASATAQAVRERGAAARAIQVDVTDRSAVRAAFAGAAAGGSINVLVNVVGGSRWSLLADTSDDEWDWVMNLNLRQQWTVAQEALPYLQRDGGGSLVAVASISGLAASTLHGVYGAAKAGLMSIVKTLAVENARFGVRVNAVAPGPIDTPARAGDDHLGDKVPLGRRGVPDDIGNAVAFLASPAASYITGHILVVDGGITQKHATRSI